MTTYDDRDLVDEELAAALSELARSMTGTVDVEQALDRTLVRAHARRRRRLVATTVVAGAAVVVGLVAMAAVTGDGRPSVRTPATAPAASAPAPPDPAPTAVVDPTVPATT